MKDHGSVTIRGEHAKKLMAKAKLGQRAKLILEGEVDRMERRSNFPIAKNPGEDMQQGEDEHDLSFKIHSVHGYEASDAAEAEPLDEKKSDKDDE